MWFIEKINRCLCGLASLVIYLQKLSMILQYIVIFINIGRAHGNLVYFIPFWHFKPREIWQPCNKLVAQLYQ
jgi:hypothetical protein